MTIITMLMALELFKVEILTLFSLTILSIRSTNHPLGTPKPAEIIVPVKSTTTITTFQLLTTTTRPIPQPIKNMRSHRDLLLFRTDTQKIQLESPQPRSMIII